MSFPGDPLFALLFITWENKGYTGTSNEKP